MSDWNYPGEAVRVERSIKSTLKDACKDHRANGATEIEPDNNYKQRVNLYT